MDELLSDGRLVAGLFSAGAVLFVAICGGLIALGRWMGSTGKEVTNLEKTAARDRSAFNKVAEEIKRDIDVIREDIKRILNLLPSTPALVQGDSPLRLTEFGKQVSASMRAPAWAGQVALELKHELAGKQPYQIDAMSRKYVQDDLSDEMKERVAIAAYEFGIEEDGVHRVLAVVLRDKLLET